MATAYADTNTERASRAIWAGRILSGLAALALTADALGCR